MTRALFIGRFQPLHKAHLEVIKNILKENDKIFIAIGSSQESNTKENPFSAEERKDMIDAVMKANRIKNYEIAEIPDFFDDGKWCGYIQEKIKGIDAAYSGNGIVLNCLKSRGFNVNKIRLIDDLNSTKIRGKIAKGTDWQKDVPKEIAGFLVKIKGIERIRNLYSKQEI